jgi:hypothetical protein
MRSDRPAFSARPQAAPSNDAANKQIEELKKKIDGLSVSLDYAIQLIKGTAPVAKKADAVVAPKAEMKAERQAEAKAEVKQVAAPEKKAAPVASKEARLAKKAPAKKVAKKGKK